MAAFAHAGMTGADYSDGGVNWTTITYATVAESTNGDGIIHIEGSHTFPSTPVARAEERHPVHAPPALPIRRETRARTPIGHAPTAPTRRTPTVRSSCTEGARNWRRC